MKVKIKKLVPEAVIPKYQTKGAAGFDLIATSQHTIPPGKMCVVQTGLQIEVPEGYVMLLKPKSSNAHLIGGGVVDWTYQGEILFKIFNTQNLPLYIYRADAVGQAIIVKNFEPTVEEVPAHEIHKTKTARGFTGGIVTQITQFESTGDEVI